MVCVSCTAPIALILSILAGDITGHAVITRRLSKKAVAPANYSLRGASLPAAAADQEPFTEFDRMVVILEGVKSAPKKPETLTIEQRDGRFDPDLVVLPVGSTVQFPNSDPIFHNVFSLSHAHSFDLGFYPKGQTRSVKFDREGIVQVYCHIHANMYAAIVITSSPWYMKPGADGAFAWKDIPAGHYRVTVWHKVAGTFKSEVEVPESGKTEVTIRVPLDTGEQR